MRQCDVMADMNRSSTSSSPPSTAGPSDTSRDNGDGQRGKRKREETDSPKDTTDGSGVGPPKRVKRCCGPCKRLKKAIDQLVAQGQYHGAVACTRISHVCIDMGEAMLLRHLQKVMSSLTNDESNGSDELGLEYANVMIYLLSMRLRDFNQRDLKYFKEFLSLYLHEGHAETLFQLADKYRQNIGDYERFRRLIVFICQEALVTIFILMDDCITLSQLEGLKAEKASFAELVRVLSAAVRDEPVPALSSSWYHEAQAAPFEDIFLEAAMGFELLEEAELLYEAGLVSITELVSMDGFSDIQEMMADEKNQSEVAMFLRKVLKQPRSLESLALLQVSRLVGQHVLGRKDRVRQLPLPSTLHDAILLCPLLSRYLGEKTEGDDHSTE